MSNTVELVIKARDEASKVLAELNQQAIKLGDTIVATADRTENANKRMEISFSSLGKIAALITAAYASLQAVVFTGDFAQKGIGQFADAEEAVRKLGVAIDVSGGNAAASMASHEDLADQVQRLANVDDAVTLDLMKQARAYGVLDESLNSVSLAAVGVSEAIGISLSEAMRKVADATKGNFDGFAGILPQLANMATAEEKLAAVQGLAQRGIESRESALQGVTGAAAASNAAMAALSQTIGAVLAPASLYLNQILATIADTLNVLLKPAIEAMAASWAVPEADAEASMNSIVEDVVWASTAIDVTWNRLGSTFDFIGQSAHLSITTMSLNLRHSLTVEMPAYVSWFCVNTLRFFWDLTVDTLKLFANMAISLFEILGALLEATSDYFTKGNTFDDALMRRIGERAKTSLLDGFQNTTESMPEIAARELTEYERSLQENISKLGQDIGTEFQDKLKQKMDAVKKNTAEQFKKNPLEVALKPIDLKKQIRPEIQELRAVESRLLNRGRGMSPIEKVEKNTDELVKLLKAFMAMIEKFLPQFLKQQVKYLMYKLIGG